MDKSEIYKNIEFDTFIFLYADVRFIVSDKGLFTTKFKISVDNSV